MNGTHVGLFTNHPEELIQFYTQKLGFEQGESRIIPADFMNQVFGVPAICQMTKLKYDTVILEVFSPENLELKLSSLPSAGYNHWGLAVDDKEQFCQALVQKGVKVIKAQYKDRFIYFIQDPEENRIEVFERQAK